MKINFREKKQFNGIIIEIETKTREDNLIKDSYEEKEYEETTNAEEFNNFEKEFKKQKKDISKDVN